MRIAIEGLQFYAHHGYYPQEREQGGSYEVDVYIDTPELSAVHTDKLADTINYEKVVDICRVEMEIPAHLIEFAAYRILQQLVQTLSTHQTPIRHLKVRLSKFEVPVGVPLRRTFVEIEKSF